MSSASQNGTTVPPADAQPQISAEAETASADAPAAKQPLPLPEPPKDGSTVQIDVGGDGVKLDHLGPLVVHEDGTMSRISNWTEMSEFERENTLRIIGKRNQARLKKLREAKGLE